MPRQPGLPKYEQQGNIPHYTADLPKIRKAMFREAYSDDYASDIYKQKMVVNYCPVSRCISGSALQAFGLMPLEEEYPQKIVKNQLNQKDVEINTLGGTKKEKRCVKQTLESKEGTKQEYTRNRDGSYHFEETDKDGHLRMEYDVFLWTKVQEDKATGAHREYECLEFDNIKIYQNLLTGQQSSREQGPLFEINRAGFYDNYQRTEWKPYKTSDGKVVREKNEGYWFLKFTGLDGKTREDVEVLIGATHSAQDDSEIKSHRPIIRYENDQKEQEEIWVQYPWRSEDNRDSTVAVWVGSKKKGRAEYQIGTINYNAEKRTSTFNRNGNRTPEVYCFTSDGQVVEKQSVNLDWSSESPKSSDETPIKGVRAKAVKVARPAECESESSLMENDEMEEIKTPTSMPMKKSTIKKKQDGEVSKIKETKPHISINERLKYRISDGCAPLQPAGNKKHVNIECFFDQGKMPRNLTKQLNRNWKDAVTPNDFRSRICKIQGFQHFEKPKPAPTQETVKKPVQKTVKKPTPTPTPKSATKPKAGQASVTKPVAKPATKQTPKSATTKQAQKPKQATTKQAKTLKPVQKPATKPKAGQASVTKPVTKPATKQTPKSATTKQAQKPKQATTKQAQKPKQATTKQAKTLKPVQKPATKPKAGQASVTKPVTKPVTKAGPKGQLMKKGKPAAQKRKW